MKAYFSGEVESKWLPDGRRMEILKMLVYTDSNGKKWVVPGKTIVDGASIPRFLWHIFGSPFVGKYRRATVIHDHYCQTHDRPSQNVHKVFFEAMRCDGVNIAKAKLMYLGIKLFGSDWK